MNNIKTTTVKLSFKNRIDHIIARLGINRNNHKVEPGLYVLGNPNKESKVFVTANYTLSFDALRSQLSRIDCFILVLDTNGINVWCAAGKGTFGTEELIKKINEVSLSSIVNHRVLIVPQLGAPGINSNKVKKITKFNVKYGPIRANDIPEFLNTGKVTAQMRKYNLNFKDRLVLIPIEITFAMIPMIIIGIIAFFTGGFLFSTAVISSILAGLVIFPILLPWIPTSKFSSKGLILGFLFAVFFSIIYFLNNNNNNLWIKIFWILSYNLIMVPITAFIALNFTGSSGLKSWSAVKNEIYTYTPVMAIMFIPGIIITIILFIIKIIGGYK